MAKNWEEKPSGFTLIELLLVIAIIGLLASLIIIAVGQAKARAQDGSIKANLSQARQEAAAIHNEDDSYAQLCSEGVLNSGRPNLAEIEREVKKRNGQQDIVCFATTDKFCVQSPLASTGHFCLDYTGRALETPTSQCNDSGYDCVP